VVARVQRIREQRSEVQDLIDSGGEGLGRLSRRSEGSGESE